jgi:AAA+ ATPase superfamily predicted ATPase
MAIPFLDRREETERIQRALGAGEPGLTVVYGRRRCGKSTLIQRIVRPGDVYVLADQCDPALQIRSVAEALAAVIPGFAVAAYPTWDALLTTLTDRATARMALLIDEFPYLVQGTPELPSLIQRQLDRPGAKRIDWLLCGSSQRMMHGAILDPSAPLYGRAREILKIRPLAAGWITDALHLSAADGVVAYSVWGGIPRYWELASEYAGLESSIKALVLDRNGVLHEEPNRLLQEEMRSAVQARSLLATIGSGCHRLSEIAARLNRPAVGLSRPLGLLIDMGLVRRDLPWGESTRSTKRTLYRIEDPFLRFFFRFVAPHQSALELGRTSDVGAEVMKGLPAHVGDAWEELARDSVPSLGLDGKTWKAAARWWGPDVDGRPMEIDVVAESYDGESLLVGEAKWSVSQGEIKGIAARLASAGRRLPFAQGRRLVPALWTRTSDLLPSDGLRIVTPDEVMGRLRD